MKWLEKYSDHAYALLRIVSGWMFSFHGAQIILRVYAEGYPPAPVGSQTWFGGMIELFGGLAVMLGLQTRFAAFLCSGTMAVAYFQFHAPSNFWPTINMGIPAIMYCFLYLYLAAAGAGPWSVDALLDKSSKPVEVAS